jgi:DNA polymerase-1
MIEEDPVKIYAFPDNPSELAAFIESDIIFGLDVETSAITDQGVFDTNAVLRTVQVGNSYEAYVFDPTNIFQKAWLMQLLSNENKKFVTHTSYDVLWIRREFGIILGDRHLDTYVLACLIEPGETRNHGLKHLTNEYIDDGLIAGETALNDVFKSIAPLETMHNADGSVKLKKDGTPSQRHLTGQKMRAYGFSNVPLDNEEFLVYAGLDAIYVRRLWSLMSPRVRDFFELAIGDLWLHRRATEWQYRGIKIDVEHTSQFLEDVEKDIADAEAEIGDISGFKARSPRLGEWLEERGVTGDVTETGRLSLDKKALPKLVNAYGDVPEVGDVLRAKLAVSANSNKAAILSSCLRSRDSSDRVHPEWKTLQAKTARFSATGVAVQTINKDDTRMRACFLPDDDYSVWVGADLNQVEVCIAAAYSRDSNLLDIVYSGKSIHDITAETAFGPAFTAKHRSYAKTTNFAAQYGAGAQAISVQGNIPLELAQRLLKAYRKAYSGLVDFGRSLEDLDPVINAFGRRIPADSGRGYANLNYIIQSTGRDLLASMIRRLYDSGWGQYIRLVLHDEIILSVPVALASQACEALEQSMSTTFKDVPIKASAKIIGKNWGGKV